MDIEIIKAQQQITGFIHGSEGYDAVSLVIAMGLSGKEWEKVKEDMPDLPSAFVEEINQHFGVTPTEDAPREDKAIIKALKKDKAFREALREVMDKFYDIGRQRVKSREVADMVWIMTEDNRPKGALLFHLDITIRQLVNEMCKVEDLMTPICKRRPVRVEERRQPGYFGREKWIVFREAKG